LLDLLLPGANGWDVLKILRSIDAFSKLPVVAYTNGYVKEMIDEALAAGATEVLNKATLTPRQLTDAIVAVCAQSAPKASKAA
jgi:CheY-like chemotaxis protein